MKRHKGNFYLFFKISIEFWVVVFNGVCFLCVVHICSVDDDDDNLYFDEEGFVDKSRRGRTENYTQAEDKLIMLAWKEVGLDPAVGTEQPKDTYWRRLKDARYNSGNVRTMTSIRHRWGTISTDCQKWSACFPQVEVLDPSDGLQKHRFNVAHIRVSKYRSHVE